MVILIPRRLIFFFWLSFLSVFFLTTTSSHAQIVKGRVFDAIDSIPIPMTSVVLNQYGTTKILSFTHTDENGKFELNLPLKKSLYTLNFRHLSYHSKTQDIIVEQESVKEIEISISLFKKAEELDEVVITATKPIIVKKDTIIYNIKHWLRENDQTLESVIAKIEGFKVLANGEIEVNGKQVRKVLIDGEEVFDVGASIFTKSLDPRKIKSIEVRFDEKNAKLKESLLDTEKYVILDIKLKDDFPTSIFGKIRSTTGYLDKIEFGGYGNFFSLRNNVKMHLFVEHDAFGHQTILLKNIKNIGKEAMQKIFELPADFKSITEKENYQEELFGFNDYIQNRKSIIGFTSKFILSKKIYLFFGTYNSFNKLGKSRFYEQSFANSTSSLFTENQKVDDFSSKSKLEIKFDNETTKVRLDVNLTYDKNNFEQNNNIESSDLNYNFKSKNTLINNYNNFFYEKKINEKVGIELKSSYSILNNDPTRTLLHNDPFYFVELNDIVGGSVTNFQQKTNLKTRYFIANAMIQYRSKIGIFEFGSQFQERSLSYVSKGINELTENELQEFTTTPEKYTVRRYQPFIKNEIYFGSFSISNRLGLSLVKFPTAITTFQNKTNLDYNLNIGYTSQNNYNLNLKYNNRLSSFPLNKLIKGSVLLDFQTIETPALSLLPQKESVVEVSLFKNYRKSKSTLVMAILLGNYKNIDQYSTQTNSSFIYLQKNQLESSYVAISTSFTKRFNSGFSIQYSVKFLCCSDTIIQ